MHIIYLSSFIIGTAISALLGNYIVNKQIAKCNHIGKNKRFYIRKYLKDYSHKETK